MTTTDLTTYTPPPLEQAAPLDRALALVGPGFALAERLAKSELVPAAYRGKPESLLACFLYGDELGLSPMVALNEIFVERGRVGITAKLIRAVLQRDGHDIWIEDQTDVMVKVGGQRKGSTHPSYVTWTLDDAKRAKLDKKDNWSQHPKAMLLARATAQLCRIIGADALAGISYAIEEIRDGFTEEIDEDLELEEAARPAGATPAKQPDNVRSLPPRTARKRTAKKAAAKPPAPAKAAASADPVAEFDAEVEEAEPSAPQPSKRAQMVAIRVTEALGRAPERDERLALLGAIVGHPVPTSKDLTPPEVDQIVLELDRLKAGAVEWSDGELTEVAVLEDTDEEAGKPPQEAEEAAGDRWTDDQWRGYVKGAGVRVAVVLKEAQRLAAEAGLDGLPGTLVEVAALPEGVLTALRVFVDEAAK